MLGSSKNNVEMLHYCIVQNFGGVNFWRIKLEDAFGW